MRNLQSLSLLSAIILSACSPDKPKAAEKIVQISQDFSGQSGNARLTITPDSIHYFSTQKDVGIARKNTPEDWQNLLKTFNIEDFKKVKQGREHIVYDGTDETLEITTNNGKYAVRNAYEDSRNFPKIEALAKELEKIETKITVKHVVE